MKVKRLLKLYSASKGTISIRLYLEIDINPEHFTYFDSINRGGLVFTPIFFLTLYLVVFAFSICVFQ